MEDEGCMQWMTERRARGVHDLLERLLGRCTCERGTAEVVRIYGAASERSRATA